MFRFRNVKGLTIDDNKEINDWLSAVFTCYAEFFKNSTYTAGISNVGSYLWPMGEVDCLSVPWEPGEGDPEGEQVAYLSIS